MLPTLEYSSDDPRYWVGQWQGVELCVYGNADGPQLNRLPTVQKVIQSLESFDSIETQAQKDLNRWFNFDPLEDEWTLLTVYFGVDGEEPINEIKLHFGLGIWDWSTEYYARYQLNEENPDQITLMGCSVKPWGDAERNRF